MEVHKERRDRKFYNFYTKWLYAKVDKNGNICEISNKISDVVEGKIDTDKIFNLLIDYLNGRFIFSSQLENIDGK